MLIDPIGFAGLARSPQKCGALGGQLDIQESFFDVMHRIKYYLDNLACQVKLSASWFLHRAEFLHKKGEESPINDAAMIAMIMMMIHTRITSTEKMATRVTTMGSGHHKMKPIIPPIYYFHNPPLQRKKSFKAPMKSSIWKLGWKYWLSRIRIIPS